MMFLLKFMFDYKDGIEVSFFFFSFFLFFFWEEDRIEVDIKSAIATRWNLRVTSVYSIL